MTIQVLVAPQSLLNLLISTILSILSPGVKVRALQSPEEHCLTTILLLPVAPPTVSHQAPALMEMAPHSKLAEPSLPYNARNVGSLEISSHQCKR